MSDERIARPEAAELAALVPICALGERALERVAASAVVHTIAADGELDIEKIARERVLYLLDGEVSLDDGGGVLRGGEDRARLRIARGGDRVLLRAHTAARLVEVDGWLVSTCLICGPGDSPSSDPAAITLNTGLLRRIPPANVQRLADLFEPFPAARGAVIVSEGDPGDYYYLIRQGDCEVLRGTGGEGTVVRVATLHAGDSFGEEALVADTPRNATVRMLGDGELLRLTKDDFAALIRDPLLRYIDHERAVREVENGVACWLDVRLPEEHRAGAPAGALNIPLGALRKRAGELDTARRYIACCNSGRRSAAAAFLLAERGLDAVALSRGLSSADTKEAPAPTYDSELAARTVRARAELEHGLHEHARTWIGGSAGPELEAAKAALVSAQRRALELESKLRAADAHAAARRQAMERSCEQLRERTTERLREGERRLSEYYSKAASQMEALRARVTAAEEAHRREDAVARERAARIRDAVQRARGEAEQQAAALRERLAERETELRSDTERRIQTERERIEAELARSIAEQERREREIDAMRVAREEGEREAELATRELARLAAERLEREAAELRLAEQRRSEAHAAFEEATRSTVDGETDEAALAEAKQTLEIAERDHRLLSERVAVAREAEETLRVQLLSEAEEWIEEERARAERDLEQARAEAEEIARFERQKEERKRATAAANADMLSEVAAQLGAEAEDDDEPVLERMIRLRAAEERAALARSAGEGASARREDAEAALAKARERLRALRGDEETGESDAGAA